jgi:hypothetical protein
VFVRGRDELTLTRITETELVVHSPEGVEELLFASPQGLSDFQQRLQRALAQIGWEFLQFVPERRMADHLRKRERDRRSRSGDR